MGKRRTKASSLRHNAARDFHPRSHVESLLWNSGWTSMATTARTRPKCELYSLGVVRLLKSYTERKERATELVHHALEVECNVPASASAITMWRLLGGLGAHGILAMREALGMPLALLGVHTGFPFWSVLFKYSGFAVSYESGINSVPQFDAHIEIYGQDKIIRI